MKTKKDLTGQRFGKWVVISSSPNRGRSVMWKCKCACGNTKDVYAVHLRNGNSTQCLGCFKVKHGRYGKPPYYTWRSMKRRCYNEQDKDYRYYGAKGISVCKEWRDNFRAFYDWAMGNGFKKGLTIDRIDSTKSYFPDNCRWVTFSQNTHNRWGKSPCECML